MENRRASLRYPLNFDEIQIQVHPGTVKCSAKNISEGGMAIEYSPVSIEQIEIETIDIMGGNDFDFIVDDVHCRTIYDIETLMESQTYSGGKSRRCGVKFTKMTQDQKKKMSALLKLL